MALDTIVLKGRGIRAEAVNGAGGPLTPGELLELGPGDGEVQEHSTAAANAAPIFAVENEVVGKGIDDDYADNDNVLYERCHPGQEVNALVAVGTAAIAQYAYLESAGDGTLRGTSANAATANTEREGIVAQALEAVDNSGGSAEVRIKVMIV